MDRDYQDNRRVTRSTFDDSQEHVAVASQRAGERSRSLLGEDAMVATLPPLIQLAEQISNLRARILSATDDLAMHSNRVLGERPEADARDLGKEISAANNIKGPPALDRLFMELSSLEASVCYFEQQAVRATGLA